MKVIFSIQARRDLQEIGDWIGLDNLERAFSFVHELEQAALSLADFPRAYATAPELGAKIRKLSYGNYLILYRVGRSVTIVAIRHAARHP